MKNETKLQRLIRKIVKEELANVQHEPHPSEAEERPPWTMFDEQTHESTHKPFESPHKHEELHHADHFDQHPESLRAEELDFRPYISKKHISTKRKKKRR